MSKKPILKPQINVVAPFAPEDTTGIFLACQVDDNGNEVPDTEFTTSFRQWEKTYSKSTSPKFILKKK